MEIIARIHTDFPEKFGIPRQSGLVDGLKGRIVFEEKYRSPEALRGLEGFSHLWLIWQFSRSIREGWSPTVKPPRLGGNRRMGVFATRSPFRPNPIGLSCVRLERVETATPEGPVLWVAGVDLLDSTPLYDIKPYLPYADCHPEATGGFAEEVGAHCLKVEFSEELLAFIPPEKRGALCELLAQDPRPGYQHDEPERVYGVAFAGWNVRFTVSGDALTVREVTPGQPARGPLCAPPRSEK